MTTNQTIDGVPRELIERVTKPLTIHDDLIDRIKARDELRALLDAPAKLDLVECDACPTSGGCVSVCMKAPKTAGQTQGEPVAVVRYSDAPADIPVTRIAHNVEFIRRVEPVAPEPHGDAYNGFVQTAPAGNDYVSMRYAHIVGNGKCPVPIIHTENGIRVNLDGYTCYAPGAEPSSKKERLSVGDVYNSCLEVLGRPSVTLRTSEELAKKLNARLDEVTRLNTK